MLVHRQANDLASNAWAHSVLLWPQELVSHHSPQGNVGLRFGGGSSRHLPATTLSTGPRETDQKRLIAPDQTRVQRRMQVVSVAESNCSDREELIATAN